MGQSELSELESILERRQAVEEELSHELAGAVDVLRRAVDAESQLETRVHRCEDDVVRCDEDGGRDLDAGANAEAIEARAAYRRRLASSLDAARRALDGARAERAEADEAHRLAKRNLASAAASRVAVEKALADARREAQRRAEDRMEEELADHMSSRRAPEEESSC
jgi:hypothetical protein